MFYDLNGFELLRNPRWHWWRYLGRILTVFKKIIAHHPINSINQNILNYLFSTIFLVQPLLLSLWILESWSTAATKIQNQSDLNSFFATVHVQTDFTAWDAQASNSNVSTSNHFELVSSKNRFKEKKCLFCGLSLKSFTKYISKESDEDAITTLPYARKGKLIRQNVNPGHIDHDPQNLGDKKGDHFNDQVESVQWTLTETMS